MLGVKSYVVAQLMLNIGIFVQIYLNRLSFFVVRLGNFFHYFYYFGVGVIENIVDFLACSFQMF